ESYSLINISIYYHLHTMASAAEKLGFGNDKSSYASSPGNKPNTKPHSDSLCARSTHHGTTDTNTTSKPRASPAGHVFNNNEVKSTATSHSKKQQSRHDGTRLFGN
ncbi:hypothetical protein Pfo_012569, partial [Paulownia fortunei]